MLVSRLGPLVFHEYLSRFGKTKVEFAQLKGVKLQNKVINIHLPDFLNRKVWDVENYTIDDLEILIFKVDFGRII